MSQNINYASRHYSIDPGATIQIYRQANFVACLAANDKFKISFDDSAESDFEAGLTYDPGRDQGSYFSRLAIRNPNATTLTIELGIGAGNIRDGRVTINAGVTLPTRESAPDVLTTGAAISAANAAATLISGANVLRREIMIVNTDSGATVYIGGNAAAAASEGVPILPGQSLTLETSAAIYARNDSGAAVALAVAEMGWSA